MKTQSLFLLSLWLFAGGRATAEILEAVPRQGAMLMPEVYYHADSDSVTVDLSNATNVVNQLTPLLVSNPEDSFDPADPWYSDLDPSQQGQAFSPRYGWDMDVMTDLLPDNRQLWIRKLDSTPGISFYDYNDYVSPKTWNPIWDTDGTTNAVYWSGLMWHFGAAAAPGTNTFAATFEIFVLDTDSGEEVPNSSTGSFVLSWTDVPDGRPALSIALTKSYQAVVSWPAAATNWFLLTSTNLSAASWVASTNPVTIQGTASFATFSNTAARRFFRLQRDP